jgi:predicted enzyme related to lactoylglutathione lyase
MLLSKAFAERGVLVLLLAFVTGCATQPRWPAITDTPTDQLTPGRWVWAELITADVDRARDFYAALFGWSFETLGDGETAYTLISNAGVRIGGMLHQAAVEKAGPRARWIGMISSEDVAASAARSVESGGDILVSPRMLGGRGSIALLTDSEGASFGVIQSDSGDPPDLFPANGEFLWRELWARDAVAMAEFYAFVAGVTPRQAAADGDKTEWHLLAGGYPRAGIVQEATEDLPSAWLHYVRVDDLVAVLRQVTANGGEVVVAPDAAVRGGTVAIIVDPLGAALGLVEWQQEGDR